MFECTETVYARQNGCKPFGKTFCGRKLIKFPDLLVLYAFFNTDGLYPTYEVKILNRITNNKQCNNLITSKTYIKLSRHMSMFLVLCRKSQ